MATLEAGYITVADADLINLGDEWIASSETEKENALSWGRIYIDANYSCYIDPDDPSDNVQYANALLGDYYVLGILYPSAGSRDEEKTTTEETVKAGSVQVTEKYAVGSGGTVLTGDPFGDISQLLAQDGCAYVGDTPTSGVATLQRAQ